jgi:hypothetical protein
MPQEISIVNFRERYYVGLCDVGSPYTAILKGHMCLNFNQVEKYTSELQSRLQQNGVYPPNVVHFPSDELVCSELRRIGFSGQWVSEEFSQDYTTRLNALKTTFSEQGLNYRSDSKLCQAYIDGTLADLTQGKLTTLQDVANEIALVQFLFKEFPVGKPTPYQGQYDDETKDIYLHIYGLMESQATEKSLHQLHPYVKQRLDKVRIDTNNIKVTDYDLNKLNQ